MSKAFYYCGLHTRRLYGIAIFRMWYSVWFITLWSPLLGMTFTPHPYQFTNFKLAFNNLIMYMFWIFSYHFQCVGCKKITRRMFCPHFWHKFVNCIDFTIIAYLHCDHKVQFDVTHPIPNLFICFFCAGTDFWYDWYH